MPLYYPNTAPASVTAPLYDKGGAVHHLAAYGFVGDDSTDNSAAWTALLAAVAEGDTIYVPPGIFRSGNVVISKGVNLIGSGPEWSVLKAKAGTTGAFFSFTSSYQTQETAGVDFDVSIVPTITAAEWSAGEHRNVHDVTSHYGDIGLRFSGTVGDLDARRLRSHEAITAGIDLQGDSQMEWVLENCLVRIDARSGGTLASAYRFRRTTGTSLGGLYLKDCRCAHTLGTTTITTGFDCEGTSAVVCYIQMSGCIADSINGAGFHFKNMGSIWITDPFVAMLVGGGASVEFDGCTDVTVMGGWLDSTTGGFIFTNGGSNFSFTNLSVRNGPVFTLPATAPPTGLRWSNIDHTGTTLYASTTQAGRLIDGVNVEQIDSARGILVDAGGGALQQFRLIDAGSGNKTHFRETASGLEIINNAFSAVIATLSDTGALSWGGGAAIKRFLSGFAAIDFPSIAAGATHDLTITVTGAAAGDLAIITVNGSLAAGLVISQVPVVTADTVTVRLANVTSAPIDPSNLTFMAGVFDIT